MTRTLQATALSLALLGLGAGLGGCAVTDHQSSVGQYVDDTTITSRVKTRFAKDDQVSASRIQVETLNGTVQLSGFAKSAAEKAQAEALAREAKGVKDVKNSIVVRGG